MFFSMPSARPNRMQWSGILTLWAALVCCPMTSQAGVVWEQGFESGTAGWSDGGNYGTITQTPSGTSGITSASGGNHATVTQSLYAPYSFFDGSRSSWPGDYTASLDIYLDTNWAAGEGFDYSVASYASGGGHLQDFIFHVTQDTSSNKLLVGGSNNTNFDPREDMDVAGFNSVEITDSGWYTFQHHFYDNGGVLAVDLNLFDSSGTHLFTETRSAAGNLIPGVVGGNGYAWFTNIDIADGIEIDNHSLEINAVPEPTSMLGFAALGICASIRGGRKLRNRRRPRQAYRGEI